MRIQLIWCVTYCRLVTVYQSVWRHTPEDLDICFNIVVWPIIQEWMGDNIKINLKKIDWEDTGLIDLSQSMNTWQALVNAVMNLRCPQNSANLLTIRGTLLLKGSASWTE